MIIKTMAKTKQKNNRQHFTLDEIRETKREPNCLNRIRGGIGLIGSSMRIAIVQS